MQPISQKAMTAEIIDKIDETGIIAVLVIDKVQNAVPLAHALLEGGVDTIELTLRTEAAIKAAEVIKKEVPEITLGFGTVLTTEQVKAAVGAGADFAVAPGCNPRVISEAIKQGLSFAPGIMTPTDIEVAVEQGCRVLKYFPAESSGGMAHLKNMASPYQYLNLKFIPLGGCNMSNVVSYLESPLITAIGGSWLANRSLIQNRSWGEISNNAKAARVLIEKIGEKE